MYCLFEKTENVWKRGRCKPIKNNLQVGSGICGNGQLEMDHYSHLFVLRKTVWMNQFWSPLSTAPSALYRIGAVSAGGTLKGRKKLLVCFKKPILGKQKNRPWITHFIHRRFCCHKDMSLNHWLACGVLSRVISGTNVKQTS